MKPLLEISNLSKTFVTGVFKRQDVKAVRKVDLCLEEGKILVLIGPNGSGKTTLVKILSTLILPSSGGATVCGFDLLRDSTRVRESVSLVTNEDRSFFWRMSCYENLRFFCILNNLSEEVLQARINTMTERLHLGEFLHKRFDRCSAGMKRRLAIARAIISRPKLLMLDEPNNSLDPDSAAAVKSVVIEQVQEYGTSVIYITHQMHEIKELPCTVAKMVLGTIVPVDSSRILESSYA